MSSLTLDLQNIKAVIFDFDGVLVDTEKLHYESFEKVLKKYGIKYVSFEDHCKVYSGKGSKFIITHFIEKNDLALNPESLVNQKLELFLQLCEQKGVSPINGVIDFIYQLQEKNIKYGICSGGDLKSINRILKLAKFPDVFSTIVSSEDVSKPKPDPEGFLKTAKKFEVPPKYCLVFEDAINGIEAAKVAKVQYIAVTSYLPQEKFKEVDPNIQIIKDFTKVKII